MCGIVGIYQPPSQGPVDSAVLREMNQALFHRGPDDEGFRINGPTGLAMRRLKIIDLDGGHQPLSNEDASVWVVFNGEIYNHQPLRRTLEGQGHRFKTQSDTEVLVHLYEERGEDLVKDLRGMFAFALWDQNTQKLMVVRDPVGIKPLFYQWRDGRLLFASELKALMAHPAFSRDIDWQALSDYLSFLVIPAPRTIFQDARKLPPGHLLVAQGGRIQIKQYWDLRFGAGNEGKSEQELQSELIALTQGAVRSHLMSDVPVGAFLSGGVDSSIISALMVQQMGPGVNTFSVGFDSARHDELSYAGAVAKHLKTRHHELRLSATAMDELPKIVSCFDEPFGDSSAIPTYHLSRFARQKVTVALAGDGGDELFAGYEWMRRERWLEAARRMPATCLSLAQGALQGRDALGVLDGPRAALARFFQDARGTPARGFYRRSTCFSEPLKNLLFAPEVKEKLGAHGSWDFFQATMARSGHGFYEQMLTWDSKVYLPDDDLCKVDRMSMAHSLEVRVPILDLDLLEWSAALPLRWKLEGLKTKHIWKKAFANLLPPLILKQRKQGFGIPLGQWIMPHLPGIRRLLMNKESFCRTVFDSREMQKVLDWQATGKFRLAAPVYLMLVLEIWHAGVVAKTSGIASRGLQEVMA